MDGCYSDKADNKFSLRIGILSLNKCSSTRKGNHSSYHFTVSGGWGSVRLVAIINQDRYRLSTILLLCMYVLRSEFPSEARWVDQNFKEI